MSNSIIGKFLRILSLPDFFNLIIIFISLFQKFHKNQKLNKRKEITIDHNCSSYF